MTASPQTPLTSPGSRALLARALATLPTDPASARLLCRLALIDEPVNGSVYQILGAVAERTGDLDRAFIETTRATLLAPFDAQAWRNLAILASRTSRPMAAARARRRALTLAADADTMIARANAAVGDLDPIQADLAYGRALALQADRHDALLNRGLVIAKYDAAFKALRLLRRALAIQPADAFGIVVLAEAVQVTSGFDAAERWVGSAEALALQSAEVVRLRVAARLAKAEADRAAGQFLIASRSIRVALALDPAEGRGAVTLAITLDSITDYRGAEIWARRALSLDLDAYPAHAALGNALRGLGRLVLARSTWRRAVALSPALGAIWSNLGNVARDCLDPATAVASYRRAIVVDPALDGAYSNMLFAMTCDARIEPMALKVAHMTFDRLYGIPRRAAWRPHDNDLDPERRLRVGYVSSDFWRHPVGFFLSPILSRHDPGAVEVFCYAGNVLEDELTGLFRANAAWRPTAHLDEVGLAELVRRDRIDILVDLAGHTAHNRLLTFARRPAPVQVSWLGYFDTTGLSAIDYFFSDPWEAPPGTERFFVEDLIRLPCGRLVYGPPSDAPLPGELPMTTSGSVTFGCLNNIAKLSPATISTWGRLMSMVRDSRLMLRSPSLGEPSVRRLIERMFDDVGVTANQLDLGTATPRQILEAYTQIDIALDPFPFTGGLTSCEALWMGVPVVTLAGVRPVSRQTVSFLSRLDLSELIADSSDDYIRIAAGLAASLPHLSHLRATMRERMRSSPLCDGRAAARAIEATYRDLWRVRCGSGRQGRESR